MKWNSDLKLEKRGLIFDPLKYGDWMKGGAIAPTPLLMGDKIRIFFGARDALGVARFAYADVDAANPYKILKVTDKPILDIGMDGCFDDNGVVPCALVERDGKIFIYYSGFQLVNKVKYISFSGLAISTES